MYGCVAPSEIPGVVANDARIFGTIAEEIVYALFCQQYVCTSNSIYQDHYNPAAYIYFLHINNPHFDAFVQYDYFYNAWTQKLAKVPDILIHSASEKAFYEIKPDSPSGIREGISKVGKLSVVYKTYLLPYSPGIKFKPKKVLVAHLGSDLQVHIDIRYAVPGLLVYKLCVKSDKIIDLSVLLVLLRIIVNEINKQKGRNRFRPIDLKPVFKSQKQLVDLARLFGMTLATTTAATVGWKFFWKAVVRRFALRGSIAGALAAIDGPLPVGDLIAIGLSLWIIIDVIKLSDELWKDAAKIAKTQIT